MTDEPTFRCQRSIAASVSEIADRTHLPEDVVVQQLLRLGLQDVETIGDEVLFGAVSSSDAASIEI